MPRDLSSILIERKLIDEHELKKALELEKKSGVQVGQILFKKGLLNEIDLLSAIGDQYNLPVQLKLEVHNLQTIIDRIPLKYIQKYRTVPYSVENFIIKVAVMDPQLLHPLDEIRILLSEYTIVPVLAPETEILKIIHNHYEKKGDSGRDSGTHVDFEEGLEFLDELQDLQGSLDLANEAPIIKMVNVILSNAISDRASDIHIEPQEKEFIIRYRVDGILHKVMSPPKSIQSGVVSRIKIMADLNIAENRLPQDGRIRIRFGGKDIDIRVSTLPTQFGERVVMRLLNKSEYNFNIHNIGFKKDLLKDYLKLINLTNGIILITGPTGSGKTTTLYASLTDINKEGVNIITVEDPIEYQIDGISQVQAKPKIGFGFAEGLRTILRQDPDVIMVGEIRDEDTARIAIQSALTGHLVFSTLHTNDAPSAVSRLMDMGIEPYLITATVRGVMAQRLLRTLCPECKKKVSIPVKALREIGMEITEKNKTISIYEAKGCKECLNSGYKGRTGIYELLIINEKLRALIIENASLDNIRKNAINIGMKSLRAAAFEKVLEGVTTLDEALRIT